MCGIVFVFELVGECWVLLVVCELFFGLWWFGELRVNLVGISVNVLI